MTGPGRAPMRDLEVFYVAFVAAMLGAAALCAMCSAAVVTAARLVCTLLGGLGCTW